MGYANLYNQTEYSLLNSTLRLDDLMVTSNKYQYTTLGICDINATHGLLKFYNSCIKNNIKPILGIHIIINNNSILFFAKNNNGYKNLLKLSSLVNGIKEVNVEEIAKYSHDLITILPGSENEVISYIISSKNFVPILNKYIDLFDDLYFGLDLQSLDMRESFSNIYNISKNYNIKCIPLRKTMFLNKEDYDAYEILRLVDTKTKKYVPLEQEYNGYMVPGITFYDEFRKYPELIKNLDNIINECNVHFEFGKFHMPKYVLPNDKKVDNFNPDEYLHDLAFIGLKKRLENIPKQNYKIYIDRINYELDVISKMGFSDYFLIVYDYVRYAKKNNILVGPGRGSGGGSLVAYALGITKIDPIEYNLLFERFLSLERKTMPDIDVDFPDKAKRDDVAKYVKEKYGSNKVAQISTFSRYGYKSAIDDVIRVKSIDEMYKGEIVRYIEEFNIKNVEELDDISKEIIEGEEDNEEINNISLDDTINKNNLFKRMIEENSTVKYIVNIIKKLDKLPRNLSVHASGIIITDSDLLDYTGFIDKGESLYRTQYNDKDLELLGLVKFDLLVVTTLSMIDKIIERIPDKSFNLDHIPLNDKETFKLLRNGETSGIFQLSSKGMTETVKLVKCDRFEDIIVSIALYRPGSKDMIPIYCKRKQGLNKIEYLHNDLENILKQTYGVIVYQEQIMLIALKFAGFSLGDADILRRAISKKKADLLVSMKESFINGAIKKGYKKDTAIEIYNLIEKFANYGFNKSHTTPYALISYQMSYLKAHYFKEYISVMINEILGNNRLIKEYIFSANNHGIKILPPNINKSTGEFVIENDTIYFSLMACKNIGTKIASDIISERNANGLFTDYDNFILRTKEFLNKDDVEMLIYSGALDVFNIPRKQMILEYDKSLQLASFGDVFKDSLVKHEFSDDEYNFEEISNFERIALGFNIKFDIFKRYAQTRVKYKCVQINKLQKDKICNILFVVDSIKQIKEKSSNQEMAFLTISDDTGSIDAPMFKDTFKIYGEYMVEGKLYIGQFKIGERNGKLQAVFKEVYIKK